MQAEQSGWYMNMMGGQQYFSAGETLTAGMGWTYVGVHQGGAAGRATPDQSAAMVEEAFGQTQVELVREQVRIDEQRQYGSDHYIEPVRFDPPPVGQGSAPPAILHEENMATTYDFYDFPVASGPSFAQAGLPAVIALSALPVAIQTAVRALPGLRAGMQIGISALPAVIRNALMALGISSGMSILIDENLSLPDVIPWPGGGGGAYPPQWGQEWVARTWNANGTPFAMAKDGEMAAQKRSGVWTLWYPEKPVVLTSKTDLKTAMRAYRRMKTIGKNARKLADTYAPKRRSPTKRTIVQQTDASGVNINK